MRAASVAARRRCPSVPATALAPRPSRFSTSAPRVAVSFDIDGVLLRGSATLPGAREAVLALVHAGVPFVFLTNGGGTLEAVKAAQLSAALQLPVHAAQVILSHTPLREAVARFADRKILVLGCRDALGVARAYGATKALDVAALLHDEPFRYPFMHVERVPLPSPLREEPFAAAFVLHDPNSWGAELQLTLDVLRGGWPLGSGGGPGSPLQAVPFFSSNADVTFAGAYDVPRLAAGAYTRALRTLWRDVHGGELEVTQCGKPEKITFDFAAAQLARWVQVERETGHWAGVRGAAAAPAPPLLAAPPPPFSAIYHIGDNPLADVRGANRAGAPWRSVLVRTGVFQGGANDPRDPAHVVVQGVGDAVKVALEHARALR